MSIVRSRDPPSARMTSPSIPPSAASALSIAAAMCRSSFSALMMMLTVGSSFSGIAEPSLPVEAERLDHRGIELGALFVPDQGKTAAAAVDPSRPDEAARFGLLAHVANPSRAVGVSRSAEMSGLPDGAELTQH